MPYVPQVYKGAERVNEYEDGIIYHHGTPNNGLKYVHIVTRDMDEALAPANVISDRIKGSLLCGAYGDALGYPVENMSGFEIFRRYGPMGMQFPSISKGKVRFSNDTQMSLLAVNGIILRDSYMRDHKEVPEPIHFVYPMYRSWAHYQIEKPPEDDGGSWILKEQSMRDIRNSGDTSLQQIIKSKIPETIESKCNNSKGSSGIVRTSAYGMRFPPEEAIRYGCADAATVHGHPLGWMSAGLLSGIISHIVHEGKDIETSVLSSLNDMESLYGTNIDWPYLKSLIESAVEESHKEYNHSLNGIKKFGKGQIAEDALTMAVYASLRFTDIYDILRFSVNHSGRSDIVGSITGNIIGAHYGYEKISQTLDFSNMEMLSPMEELMNDFIHGFPSEGRLDEKSEWIRKYTDFDHIA